MQTSPFIWKNGQFQDWDDNQTHVLSHSLHYGGAVFEGLRAYATERGPAVFRLRDHMERFLYSMGAIELESRFSLEELCEAILETVRRNELQACYIRPLAYYGYGKMGLNPTGAPTDIIIAAWDFPKYLPGDAIKVKVSRFQRIHPATSDLKAKLSGHYVNSIMASQEIKKAGCDEALFLDYRGNLAEGPGENLFFVKDGTLFTPSGETPAGNAILKGLTRDSVMTLARDRDLDVQEGVFTLEDLLSADEAFFTGTAAEVTPIGQVNDQAIGKGQPGPISLQLKKDYMDVVHGRVEERLDWLSFI